MWDDESVILFDCSIHFSMCIYIKNSSTVWAKTHKHHVETNTAQK